MPGLEMDWFGILVSLAVGYLLGSVPYGLLLTRFAGVGDIRTIGSGNIGTTNVLRTGRKDLAAATLLLDALKGTIAVLLMRHFYGEAGALAAALGAFAGHLFPIWLSFRGGKGVATFLGLLLAFSWPTALVFALVWIGVAALFRYSSLGGMSAAVAGPIVLYAFTGDGRATLLFAVLAVLLLFMHRANIGRLLNGTESRIGRKASSPGSSEG
jgi:glycerol-3-phosphate acyltransferase PlsY